MAAGYPRLRALRNDRTTYFFELTAAWPKEQTRALLSAFIRWFTARSGGPADALSELETAMHARFEFPGAYSPSVLAQQTRLLAGELKLDKKLLQRTIKQRVEAALGVKGKSLNGAWRYVSQLDEVTGLYGPRFWPKEPPTGKLAERGTRPRRSHRGGHARSTADQL